MNKNLSHMIVFIAFLLLGISPQAPQQVLCEGFLPKNQEIQIPVDAYQAGGIDQDAFNQILDRLEAVYAPVIQAMGGNFKVNRLWRSPTVNASAERRGKDWIINMYGGLARYPSMTRDGFASVACHELGHHMGGFPKSDWATNEGGADYYSTLKCLRRIFPADEVPTQVDPYARQQCAAFHSTEAERNRCERNVMAGITLSEILAELGGEKRPSLVTPDPTVVTHMVDWHPFAQCRLDTYFQAALCAKSVDEELSNTSPVPGACTKSQGYEVGMRSRCWYMPPSPEVEVQAKFDDRKFESKADSDIWGLDESDEEDTHCLGSCSNSFLNHWRQLSMKFWPYQPIPKR